MQRARKALSLSLALSLALSLSLSLSVSVSLCLSLSRSLSRSLSTPQPHPLSLSPSLSHRSPRRYGRSAREKPIGCFKSDKQARVKGRSLSLYLSLSLSLSLSLCSAREKTVKRRSNVDHVQSSHGSHLKITPRPSVSAARRRRLHTRRRPQCRPCDSRLTAARCSSHPSPHPLAAAPLLLGRCGV
jgi:hypothetical protein